MESKFFCLVFICMFIFGCQYRSPDTNPPPAVPLPGPNQGGEAGTSTEKGVPSVSLTPESDRDVNPIALEGSTIPRSLDDKIFEKRYAHREKTKFDTWILFLVTDEGMLKDRKEDLVEMKDAFLSFGRSIHDDHLAQWLSKERGSDIKKTDIDKMIYYCSQKFGMDLTHGPYVVISKIHPDLIQEGDEFFQIRLKGIDRDEVRKILNTLVLTINNNKLTTLDLFRQEKEALVLSQFFKITKALGIEVEIDILGVVKVKFSK